MSAADIQIANSDRIATETLTESALTRHLQRVLIEQSGAHSARAPGDCLCRYLRVDGGDAGAFAMNTNGSGAAIDHEYIVPASKVARISEITGYLTDATAFTAATFGGATALSTGLTLKALDSDDSALLDFFNGDTITTNADLVTLCGPEALLVANDLSIATIRIDLIRMLGAPLVLTAGQYLQAKIQDDLTVLTGFALMVRGVELDA